MKKKSIWMGVCTAIVGFAVTALAAQTQPPASGQSSRSTNDQRVTVTGCLKAAPSTDTGAAGTAGTTGATGTTGTTGAAGATGAAGDTLSTQRFILTNASSSPASESSGAATSGTTAGEPGTPGTATYRLIANPAALAPHVGKKLELTGTVDNSSASASTEASSGSEANAPTLHVESGKILAASCTQ